MKKRLNVASLKCESRARRESGDPPAPAEPLFWRRAWHPDNDRAGDFLLKNLESIRGKGNFNLLSRSFDLGKLHALYPRNQKS
jgi:hypothetical protein